MTPQSPCYHCQDRHVGCHNDTCPHGWAEYEKAHLDALEEKQKAVERSGLYLTDGMKRKMRTKDREEKRKRCGR